MQVPADKAQTQYQYQVQVQFKLVPARAGVGLLSPTWPQTENFAVISLQQLVQPTGWSTDGSVNVTTSSNMQQQQQRQQQQKPVQVD
ncbi:hypothetical protein AWZ03_011022 [Drosophila navojoa]|uniref:Uncharacterized protein n=1 Tax=Drosophila navojoa TaxID=7232 RepID=A0A484B2Q2_DRONA|nr:hypothetical protein AWZ03_011022 [Drosophila navojoa]